VFCFCFGEGSASACPQSKNYEIEQHRSAFNDHYSTIVQGPAPAIRSTFVIVETSLQVSMKVSITAFLFLYIPPTIIYPVGFLLLINHLNTCDLLFEYMGNILIMHILCSRIVFPSLTLRIGFNLNHPFRQRERL